MRRVLVGILASAGLALTGCSVDQDGAEGVADKESCVYDEETLLPALEAAVPAEATVRMTMDIASTWKGRLPTRTPVLRWT